MVSPLTNVFQTDPKLGKELANVKGFGEIDHSAWLTGGTGAQTCCSGARPCVASGARPCHCAARKTFPKRSPTPTVTSSQR